jgi:adenylate cyclase
MSAWLEKKGSPNLPLSSAFSLGRSEGNSLVLDDHTVSRRHAMLQKQGDDEYWLVDFGSRNGTYQNGRRIAQPTRLNDGDQIGIGGVQLVFRASETTAAQVNVSANAGDMTCFAIRPSQTWLFVADVISSTRLVNALSPDELPVMMGQWLMACREIIEKTGGRINQFMGDGFFAYWTDRPNVTNDLLQAITELRQMQTKASPDFRFVLHFGPVILGGVAIGEEERISGGEVHYIFRMEKLAGQLGENTLFSATAQAGLADKLTFQEQGRHSLHGFDGDFPFYSL